LQIAFREAKTLLVKKSASDGVFAPVSNRESQEIFPSASETAPISLQRFSSSSFHFLAKFALKAVFERIFPPPLVEFGWFFLCILAFVRSSVPSRIVSFCAVFGAKSFALNF
jgi:hypothetical protein